MRPLCPILITVAVALLTGCGGGEPEPAPGSPGNPLRAQRSPERTLPATRVHEANGKAEPTAKIPGKPGYRKLLERQARRPRKRFTPCSLVTVAQARTIIGGPILTPLEAPQGPTCIYRPQSGKSFITVAVQTAALSKLRRQLPKAQRVSVGGRVAYCGRLGQPVLYMEISATRVLSISAPCDTARQFAAKAAPRLRA
jgi:hypothetical protein